MSIYLMSLVSRTRACGWSTRWRNVFIFSWWLLGQCHSWTESILSMWCAQCRVTVSQSIQVLTNITEVQETKWSTHLSTNQLRDFLCFNQSEERFPSVNQSEEIFFFVTNQKSSLCVNQLKYQDSLILDRITENWSSSSWRFHDEWSESRLLHAACSRVLTKPGLNLFILRDDVESLKYYFRLNFYLTDMFKKEKEYFNLKI